MAHKILSTEDRRAAHRRGHSVNLTERVLDDRGPRIPRGGAIGEVITKSSLDNDEIAWGAGGGGGGSAGPAGPQGPAGPEGPAGAAGVGVPTGGTTGQVLAKINNTDYNTQWVTPSAGGGSDPRMWDTDYIWVPPHQNQLNSLNLTTLGDTAYFVYLGLTKAAVSPVAVRYRIQTNPFITFFETGLFFSDSPPARANKLLTCLIADSAVSQATLGDKSHTISGTIAANTHVWVGFRTYTFPDSGGSSSAVVRAIGGDYGRGSILTSFTSPSFEAFAPGQQFTGVPSTAAPDVPAAPYTYITFS